VYQQQQQQRQEQEQEQQDAANPFLDPPFSRIKTLNVGLFPPGFETGPSSRSSYKLSNQLRLQMCL
jgi:hypothetical protein